MTFAIQGWNLKFNHWFDLIFFGQQSDFIFRHLPFQRVETALLTRKMVAPAHHIVQRGKSAANYAIKWRLWRKLFYPALYWFNILQFKLMLHLTKETHAFTKAIQQSEMGFRTHDREWNAWQSGPVPTSINRSPCRYGATTMLSRIWRTSISLGSRTEVRLYALFHLCSIFT